MTTAEDILEAMFVDRWMTLNDVKNRAKTRNKLELSSQEIGNHLSKYVQQGRVIKELWNAGDVPMYRRIA